jgi:hypothetical protein
MDGYGARVGVSTGIRDPLYCRALVLDDGETRLALAVCDLIGVGRSLVERARTLIAETCEIPAERVLIAATHTHAGPAGVRGRADTELSGITARKIAGAVATAHRSVRPAVLKAGAGIADSVSLNRRDPAWPVEPAVQVLQVDEPDGSPIATLVNFACHATVMNYDNLLLSADYPGAAVRTVERLIGGVGLLFNGACANVNPVWIRQDFSEVERVGAVIGAEAAKVAAELRPLGHGQRAHNIRWNELTEKPVTRGAIVHPSLAGVSTRLHLSFKDFLDAEEYELRLAEIDQQLADPALDRARRREVMARRTMLTAERSQLRRVQDSGDRDGREIEVQALRFGDGVGIVALPGDWFVETAWEITRRCGFHRLFVACYANDYPGYITPPEAYPQGGYEAGMTPFRDDAEPASVAAALDVLARVR